MLCDFCHEREAVIYVEQPSGTQRRRVYMCSECAAERGIPTDSKNIGSSLGILFRELADVSRRMNEKDSKCCPVCGISLSEIKRTGKVGCPECYEVFKGDIKQLIENNGIKEAFTGKMPARLASFRSVLNDRIILRHKLESALESEEYEKAAKYRDYLKALESKAVSGVPDDEKDGDKI